MADNIICELVLERIFDERKTRRALHIDITDYVNRNDVRFVLRACSLQSEHRDVFIRLDNVLSVSMAHRLEMAINVVSLFEHSLAVPGYDRAPGGRLFLNGQPGALAVRGI